MRDRGRVSGGEFCFCYAEDMSAFGSPPSGCLSAGFTIVASINSLLFCHVCSKLSTIHNTVTITDTVSLCQLLHAIMVFIVWIWLQNFPKYTCIPEE